MDMIYIIAAYIISGVLAYGITLAYFQNEKRYSELVKAEEYQKDLSFSVFIGLFGPIGLFIAIFSSGFLEKGFRLR